ncbi:hypothetical protein BGP_6606 [Beggiatoa sp. PS]|nr:hypothetical protein BGP_6606 [Beggiatoa sp. PS]
MREEGILTEHDGVFKVLSLQKASACLDKQWDDFFNPAQSINS